MIINKTKTAELTLAIARHIRPAAGFERVSAQFLARVESALRQHIVAEIQRHPSKGKTIK